MVMKKILISSAAAAAILASGAAFAQSARPAQAAPAANTKAEQPLTRAMVQSRVAAMFSKLDANHDGFITKDELSTVEAQRAQNIEERAAKFDPSKIFDRIDANHDGKITLAEVNALRSKRAGAAAGAQPQETSFKGILAQADTNKDGVVTRAEFEVVGQQIKARMQRAAATPGAMATRMFDVADTNKDGRVSLAEMQASALARFDRLDLNRDGTVTPQERQQASQALKAQHHKS
jgi:Ca2+-binding EF-hand superfamily protein